MISPSLLRLPLWALLDDVELTEDERIFYNLMTNLEAYGTPVPCLYELPPKGGTTHAEL